MDIHASSGMRTHDPDIRSNEDGSRLRPRGHRDWLVPTFYLLVVSLWKAP
jgi:hypothetical protein